MDAFFDPNVLVASSHASHPQYSRAAVVVEEVIGRRSRGWISVHAIAEVFSALTRMPIRPKIHPADAARVIVDDLLGHFSPVAISVEDYLAALEMMTKSGWTGARIYDALLLRCAEKCGAERIYTFDVAHFRQIAPENLVGKICAP